MNLTTLTMQLGNYLAQLDPAALPYLRLDLTFRLDGEPVFNECVPRTGLPGLLKLIQAKSGAEIGVQRAEFSTYLLSHWPGKLWLVDPWEHQEAGYTDVANVDDAEHEANYLAALEALRPFEGRYDIIKGYSTCAAGFFFDEQLDFVYLDGNHGFEAVAEDLQAWISKVRPGGIVAGHDFVDYDGPLGSFRVRSAVTKFCQETGRELYVSREPWPSLWYFIR